MSEETLVTELLTELSEEVAAKLVSSNKSISLPRLASLTCEAAKILATSPKDLHLNGLATLSDEVAKELAKHSGKLTLNRLKRLSADAAWSFIPHEGTLELLGLDYLSDLQVCGLAMRSQKVSLQGAPSLGSLSTLRRAGWVLLDQEVAGHLSEEWGWFYTSSFTHLPIAVGRVLADIRGHCHLDGLTELSEEAAECLREHKGVLWLDGIINLSPACAVSLSNHLGTLFCRGLRSQTPEIRKILSRVRGTVHLPAGAFRSNNAEFLRALFGLTQAGPMLRSTIHLMGKFGIYTVPMNPRSLNGFLANVEEYCRTEGRPIPREEIEAIMWDIAGEWFLRGLEALPLNRPEAWWLSFLWGDVERALEFLP